MVSINVPHTDDTAPTSGEPGHDGRSAPSISDLAREDILRLTGLIGLIGFQLVAMVFLPSRATIAIVALGLLLVIGVSLLADLISVERRKRQRDPHQHELDGNPTPAEAAMPTRSKAKPPDPAVVASGAARPAP